MKWLRFSLIAMGAAYLVWKGLSHAKSDALVKSPEPGEEKQAPAPAPDDMAAELVDETDVLERHRIMSRHVGKAYQKRNDPDMKAMFYRYAHTHLDEVSENESELVLANNGKMPTIITFKLLAMALEADGKYGEAIAVCEEAMALGVKDGTKTGFEGRIDRLKKKKDSA